MKNEYKEIMCKFTLSIGYPTATREDEFPVEVPVNATESEIEAITNDEWLMWSQNYIDGGVEIKEEVR